MNGKQLIHHIINNNLLESDVLICGNSEDYSPDLSQPTSIDEVLTTINEETDDHQLLLIVDKIIES